MASDMRHVHEVTKGLRQLCIIDQPARLSLLLMHPVTQLVNDGAMPFHAQQLSEGDATFYQDDMDVLSHNVPSLCAPQDKFSSRSNVAGSFFTQLLGLLEVQEEPGARARLAAQPQFGNDSPKYPPSAAAGLEAAAQPSAMALT